jgi:hypothetical protein
MTKFQLGSLAITHNELVGESGSDDLHVENFLYLLEVSSKTARVDLNQPGAAAAQTNRSTKFGSHSLLEW